MIWISIALSAAGLIAMYGIYYGFDRIAIGRSVMMLFEIAAFVTTTIAVSKVKEVKNNDELLEGAEAYLIEKRNRTLGTYSFISFFMILMVMLLSHRSLFILFVPVLAFILIRWKAPYMAWITGQQYVNANSPKVRQLNLLQLGTILSATILFTTTLAIYSYYMVSSNKTPSYPPLFSIIIALTCALTLFNLICLIVFLVKCKEDRNAFLTSGIRNFLMTPSVLIFSGIHRMLYTTSITITGTAPSATQIIIEYQWSWLDLCDGLAFVCTIAIIFELIKAMLKKPRKSKRQIL